MMLKGYVPPDAPFDLSSDGAKKFVDVVDHFNPENRLTGYIKVSTGSHYGSLYITHVNGEMAPQVIPSAPKQHYPFDTRGMWDFPNHEHIEIYEKLDGSCIIGFVYHDATWENEYVTYKSRKTPVLINEEGAYGNLVPLWEEMLAKYQINSLVETYAGYSWMFELYGRRRHHLIRYPVSLDTRCIFARQNYGRYGVLAPSQVSELLDSFGIPSVDRLKCIDLHDSVLLREVYLSELTALESKIIHYEMDLPDEKDNPTTIGVLGGMEGTVWYYMQALPNEHMLLAVQHKCKPKSVLDYHWDPNRSKGPHIPIQSIYMTVANAFEETSHPEMSLIKELLAEEYPLEIIERAQGTIQRVLDEALFRRNMAIELLVIYKQLGLDWATHRGDIMRQVNTQLLKDYDGRRRKYMAKLAFDILNNEVGSGDA